MRLHKTIQPREVAAGTVGHAHHIRAADGEEREQVDFAFGDDALRGARDAVDIVRNEFGTGDHFEILAPVAIFGVNQLVFFKIIETETLMILFI